MTAPGATAADCRVVKGCRIGGVCTRGTRDCVLVAHADLRLAGHGNVHGQRPKRGWADDRTVWHCSRCDTVQVGLVPFMHGGCPQPRAGEGRCGTILLRLSPSRRGQ